MPELPPPLIDQEVRQTAALPWRVRDGVVMVLMITSRETRRWVIPKGGLMPGKTDSEAAAQEAMEEAGALGPVADQSIGDFRYLKRLRTGADQPCRVAVYPLRVLVQLGDWPEREQRERRWMTVEDAAAAVAEPDLARIIRDFGASRPS